MTIGNQSQSNKLKTTELSKPILLVVLLLMIFNAYQAYFHFEKMVWGIMITSVFVLLIAGLFYKLDIEIDSEQIFMRFGIGMITRRIPLQSIDSFREVRNSVFAGWGLRFNAKYVLYSASSLKAVELSFKDHSERVRIGTDVPEKIISYLSRNLGDRGAAISAG